MSGHGDGHGTTRVGLFWSIVVLNVSFTFKISCCMPQIDRGVGMRSEGSSGMPVTTTGASSAVTNKDEGKIKMCAERLLSGIQSFCKNPMAFYHIFRSSQGLGEGSGGGNAMHLQRPTSPRQHQNEQPQQGHISTISSIAHYRQREGLSDDSHLPHRRFKRHGYPQTHSRFSTRVFQFRPHFFSVEKRPDWQSQSEEEYYEDDDGRAEDAEQQDEESDEDDSFDERYTSIETLTDSDIESENDQKRKNIVDACCRNACNHREFQQFCSTYNNPGSNSRTKVNQPRSNFGSPNQRTTAGANRPKATGGIRETSTTRGPPDPPSDVDNGEIRAEFGKPTFIGGNSKSGGRGPGSSGSHNPTYNEHHRRHEGHTRYSGRNASAELSSEFPSSLYKLSVTDAPVNPEVGFGMDLSDGILFSN